MCYPPSQTLAKGENTMSFASNFAAKPETLQVGDTVYVAGSNLAHIIMTDYHDGTVQVGRLGSDFSSCYKRENLWKFDRAAFEAAEREYMLRGAE
jgi:hypothetical protein